MSTRYAMVEFSEWAEDPGTKVAAYLPANYTVVGVYTAHDHDDSIRTKHQVLIAGNDSHGWTLEDYVIPRLGSGLYWCHELVVKEST